MNSYLKQREYNAEKGEIRIADEDWIMMRGSTFRSLFEATERILGRGAASVWLEAGRQAGRELSESLIKLGMEFEELPQLLEEFFTEGGWGKIRTNVNFEEKEAWVIIVNSATARQINGTKPVCHFVRGFIAGLSDVMFHGLTECLETKCIAKGDAYCEFQVKRRQPC
jgi:predicted hydrocarbon binding protein